MIKFIKKVLAHHQVEQAQKRRIANNKIQHQLILQGLEERGY